MENQRPTQTPKKNAILEWVKSNKLSSFLCLIIIFLLVTIGMQSLEKSRLMAEQKASLAKATILGNEELAAVFTWSVRSELMRGNQDNVNQLFLRLLKNPSVTKVQLIDPETQKVVLSTDKKDEGVVIKDTEIVNTKNQKKIEADNSYTIIIPVISIDRIIGVIVVEFKK